MHYEVIQAFKFCIYSFYCIFITKVFGQIMHKCIMMHILVTLVHTFTQVVLVFRSRWLEEINLVQVFPWPKYTLVCMYLKNNCKKCVMLFWGNDTVDKAIIRVKFHVKSFYSYRQLKINCHEIILCLPTILLHILYPMYFIALWEE